jgi:hypothetical protein
MHIGCPSSEKANLSRSARKPDSASIDASCLFPSKTIYKKYQHQMVNTISYVYAIKISNTSILKDRDECLGL